MPLYGTTSDRSPRTDTSVTISAHEDESRRPLLGDKSDSMTLADVLYAYDLTLAQLAFQRFGRNKAARAAWEVLSHTSDGILWFLTVLPVLLGMWYLGMLDNISHASKTVIVAFYVCNIVDIILIMVMKFLFKRQRPPHHHNDGRFVGPDQHSFPSGHATRSWCIVVFINDLCSRHPVIAREFFHMSPDVLRVLIIVWAVVIGFSRIALGRHYPSDVVAGAIIGAAIFYPISLFSIRHFTTLTDY